MLKKQIVAGGKNIRENKNMEKIKIKIDVIGRPSIEAEGFIGGACKNATQPFLDALSDGDSLINEDKPELIMLEEEEETHNYLGL